MATLEEIVIQLTAETGQLRAEMASAAKAVKSNTDQMDKAVKAFSEAGSKNASVFQIAIGTMAGFIGSKVVTGAFHALVDIGKELIGSMIDGGAEAEKEQASLNVLANSLAATGHYSKEALQGLSDYAAEMEGLAMVNQDVIQSNMQVLESMTKLNVSGLKTATTLAINFAAAYNKDLGSASEMIGKAINGNAMAFEKLGIHIDLTSSKSENLRRIHEALASTQGAAAAKAATFSGALFVLKDSYGDLFKEMSKSVTQNHTVIAVMNALSTILQQVQKYFVDNASTIREDLGKALIWLIGIVQDTAIGLKLFFQIMEAGFKVAMIPVYNMIDALQTLNAAAHGDWDGVKKNLSDIISNYTEAGKAIAAVGGDSSGFDPIIDALGRVKSSAVSAFDEFGGAAANANDGMKNTGKNAGDLVTKLNDHQKAIQSWANDLAKAFNDIAGQTTLMKDSLQANLDQQLISTTTYYDSLTLLQTDQYQKEKDQLDSAFSQKLISIEAYHDAEKQLALKNAADQKKIDNDRYKTKQADFKSTMDIIAGLANSSSKELATIGKAAAIYNATIDGYAAVQKALAQGGFLGIGMAAVVGAAAAANVAKIAGVSGLAGGIDSVPGSAGGGNNGDNFPAMLKKGERVVPTQTNQDLKEFLSRQDGGGSANITLTVNVMPGTGMNSEQIGNLIEQFNHYFSMGGMKLLGGT